MIEPGREIEAICSSLAGSDYTVKFSGWSALDMYLRMPVLPHVWIETNAGIAVLARLVDNLRFPGVEIGDGAVDIADIDANRSDDNRLDDNRLNGGNSFSRTVFFRCMDGDERQQFSIPLLSLTFDWRTKRFQDPLGIYPQLADLRKKKDRFFPPEPDSIRAIMDAALFISRYSPSQETLRRFFMRFKMAWENCRSEGEPKPEAQRVFLSCLLVSPNAELGLQLIKQSGLLKELWPELASLDEVDHSKEYHPEGNVWSHTLETLRYRKAVSPGGFDLRLSLALLLHDMGKPISASFGNNRFDGHAELGARAAARFLKRLGFSASFTEDIFFLVKNHMLPAALKRLPLVKTAEIMASPLFPTLLELYRCDESSSFKGLDGYYENSAAYQAYLKNLKNPYRSPDGKKMGKRKMNQIFL